MFDFGFRCGSGSRVMFLETLKLNEAWYHVGTCSAPLLFFKFLLKIARCANAFSLRFVVKMFPHLYIVEGPKGGVGSVRCPVN